MGVRGRFARTPIPPLLCRGAALVDGCLNTLQ
ncbi:hypothetical protein Krac_8459 [Ktedonobacter racemifer DSM 44963]|uniref:Uncharacterized protein n=1 Tax=Ktedonobacter racemifer DSM 44963 TaxID=485913 RepID=D6TMY4_KTERA|nr:hypothetical protein Krac_8459 [Ktedonobacter racemifer DSM 44963]